jgi:capsular exopolysaccharide synthesis family protein
MLLEGVEAVKDRPAHQDLAQRPARAPMLGAVPGSLALDPRGLLDVVKARRWLLGSAAALAGIIAFALSASQPDRYTASAGLLFGRTTTADALVTGGAADTASGTGLSPATNLALASLDTVVARVKARFTSQATLQDLKAAVDVHQDGQSDVVTVSATWSTPSGAAAIANAFADEIVAYRRDTSRNEIQRAIDALNRTIATLDRGRGASAQVRSLEGSVSQLQVLKSLQTGDVRVVQRATPPGARSSPHPLRNAMAAAAAAFVLALLGVILLGGRDPRVRDEEELVALLGAPVLARIPVVAAGRGRHRGPLHESPAFAEAIEFLRLNLELMRPPGGAANGQPDPQLDRSLVVEVEGGFTHPALGGSVRRSRRSVMDALNRLARQGAGDLLGRRPVIAVTSPVEGEGKTTVVAALAQSLAAAGSEVVAVDLDLRRPSLNEAFDVAVRADGGVLRALVGGGDPEQQAQPTTLARLRVLGGGVTPGPVATERLRRLFDSLRRTADCVVVDTSPVTSVAETSAAAAAADGVIVVVDLRDARRPDVLAARQQLGNAHARVLGLVLNHAAPDMLPYLAPEPGRTLELAASASRG